MKIGMIDVDGHNWPNLALMKLSAWHKAQGDLVEWWYGFGKYDRVYMSKVFDETYSPDIPEPYNTDEVVKGGTGYGLDNHLPDEVEHMMPDYRLYHWMPQDTAYGFLTRGCPRHCNFCIVGDKEGLKSRKVADLSEFWDGQKEIKLLDPNLLACKERENLLQQLAGSKALVDFTQGLDIRLIDKNTVKLINKIRVKRLHFAWDNPEDDLEPYFAGFNEYSEKKYTGTKSAYVLTNFGSTLEQDLYRIYTLIRLGFDPYVMIYDKPNAPVEVKKLQRWCNAVWIRKSEPDFRKYKSQK